MRSLALVAPFLCALAITLTVACAPSVDADAGPSSDAGAEGDGGVRDGGRDGGATSSMDVCTFNEDCPTAERCECDEQTGCLCLRGTRGAGEVGVDTCTSGNDCATALCVEGPGGTFYCSGPCSTEAQCAGELPVCADIALVGRICIRTSA